jgi:N-acetyl sugar amidotransferase
MSNSNYQICTRCVMDTSDMDIVFDEKGQCNHCTKFIENKSKVTYVKGISEKTLETIITNVKAKGKGKKYDCLMGISGGVDSCYAVYLAKKWGLNPLLMHMDNGWNSDIAVKNIKSLVQKLGVDYVSYVIDWQEFREVQLGFLKSSSVDLEVPTDIAIPASLYETASKYNISYLVSGGNATSEGILPLTWGYHVMKDMKMYKYIVSKFSKVKLKKVPHVSILGEIYYKFVKNIKTIYPLSYIDYDKDKAKEFLKAEFGWEEYGGKHHESKITAFWQSYAMPVKYNMDYRRATFSSKICAGHLSREDALEELKALPYNPDTIDDMKQYIAKKYQITNEELERCLALPPKTYKDFPNNKKLIDFVMDTYRKIFAKGRI